MSLSENPCPHPKEMVFHLRCSVYICMACGHTSHLEGKPYFCHLPTCSDVHTLTYPELLEHKKSAHPEEKRSHESAS